MISVVLEWEEIHQTLLCRFVTKEVKLAAQTLIWSLAPWGLLCNSLQHLNILLDIS